MKRSTKQNLSHGPCRVLCALLAAVFVLSLAGCGSGSASFTWFVDTIPSNLDPQVASTASDVIACENLYSGLVRKDASGKLVPALAEHWEVSSDRRTYTFTLKSGLAYTATKGAATDYAITAEDFVFAFRRMFRADTASPYAVEFSAIENSAAVLAGQLPETALGVQARGDATLVFCLSEPDENFLSKLTLPGAMPCDEDFFNSTRGTYGLSAASTLSSGRFYLYNWTASGLFLRREPSGNRIDSLRLVQNTGASGQSAAQLIANEKCSAALDETGEATSLQSISYSDTTWSLLFNCNSVFGSTPLRQALAEYLEEYRGVRCGPHQLVVGAGLEYLLGLLAPLLPGPAAVENPGYPRARQVLENNGISCCCLPVDEDGLSIRALSESGAAVCYVTPSHQFPTGVTMPAGRRAELLHWAARRPGQRYIIEDDYDSEFRFDTRPLPSLQGMAGADGPVVYLSTCSRSLAPSIRIAYMVLPEQLLPAWHAKYALYSGTVSRFEQQTLARFITGGYFTRHLARERVAYKARRDALTKALREAFAPEELHLTGLHTGLHLLAQLKDPPPDAALRAAARQYGVRCSLLSDYDLTGTAHSAAGTLVLGYGSLDDAACASVGQTLKRVCTEAREASVNP